jgi:hypothetical protein
MPASNPLIDPTGVAFSKTKATPVCFWQTLA